MVYDIVLPTLPEMTLEYTPNWQSVSMSFTLAEEELEAEMVWMVLGFCLEITVLPRAIFRWQNMNGILWDFNNIFYV